MNNPTLDITSLCPPVSIRWETESGYWRETRVPGAAIDDLPQVLQDEILAHWTVDLVQAFQAEQAALSAPIAAPPLPELTPRQLRLMLLQINMTEQDITTSIEAIADPAERAAALIEWNWATRYERDHPLVVQLSAALEFTPEQIDTLWAYAADL